MSVAERSSTRQGMRVHVYRQPADACRAVADRMASLLSNPPRAGVTLGLATGSTPIPIYAELVRRHREAGLSFRGAATYNLDEYYPLSPCDPQSYRAFMHQHLFAHVDLPANRAHLLDGTVPERFAQEAVANYDRWIEADGGLDFQLLGLGRNGHVGFNEPSDMPVEEALALPTRIVELHPVTRRDAVREFGALDKVPTHALTVGTGPILAAREIAILAFGAAKAEAVAQSLEGPITAQVPGSLLRTAGDRVTWYLDPEAASLLSGD